MSDTTLLNKNGEVAPLLLGLALAITIFSTGCYEQRVAIDVHADGSGEIAITRIASDNVMKYHVIDKQKQREALEKLFFDEAILEKQAEILGTGVELVSAREIKGRGAYGSLVRYRFPDIQNVNMPMDILSPAVVDIMMRGQMEIPVCPERAYAFQLVKGDTARLSIRTPTQLTEYTKLIMDASSEAPETAEPPSNDMSLRLWSQTGGPNNPFGLTGEDPVLDALRKLYRGSSYELSIGLPGEIVDTNARYREENRVIMLRARPEVVITDKNAVRVMFGMTVGAGDSPRFFGSMVGLPEVMIETNSVITVEFK